jgi:hypothetical protein
MRVKELATLREKLPVRGPPDDEYSAQSNAKINSLDSAAEPAA